MSRRYLGPGQPCDHGFTATPDGGPEQCQMCKKLLSHCRIGRVWAKLPNGGRLQIVHQANHQLTPETVCELIKEVRAEYPGRQPPSARASVWSA